MQSLLGKSKQWGKVIKTRQVFNTELRYCIKMNIKLCKWNIFIYILHGIYVNNCITILCLESVLNIWKTNHITECKPMWNKYVAQLLHCGVNKIILEYTFCSNARINNKSLGNTSKINSGLCSFILLLM